MLFVNMANTRPWRMMLCIVLTSFSWPAMHHITYTMLRQPSASVPVVIGKLKLLYIITVLQRARHLLESEDKLAFLYTKNYRYSLRFVSCLKT